MSYTEIDPIYKYIVCFIVSLLIFHLLFVYPRNLKEYKWKYIDYILIIAGLFSLITISSQVRRADAVSAEKSAFTQTKAMYNLFSSFYLDRPSVDFCTHLVKRSSSPSNFDEIKKEFKHACAWNKSFIIAFRKAVLPNFNRVKWNQFSPPHFKINGLNRSLYDMKTQFEYYNESAKELALIRKARKQTKVESISFILWPYILSIAAALGITKASGELRRIKAA